MAIVGSRNASQQALDFTDARAHVAVKENKVVVSGFAKGVDLQALESALKYKGKSIVVLPQGITTFTSGFKQYYQQIWEGDVLVLSTFHPKARWTAQLAMSRNPIIYGLADEIYVAECQEKSGTWAGVIDGLRKGRTIFIRKSGTTETNVNNRLISMGAKPIEAEQPVAIPEPSGLIVAEGQGNKYSTGIAISQPEEIKPAKKGRKFKKPGDALQQKLDIQL